MKFRILAAALALPLALSGCGLLAEVGVLDESYKGSFIRGDAWAALCTASGGHYDARDRGSCPDFKLSEVF